MMTGPVKALRNSKDVTKELHFMIKHIERKSNEVIFKKCSNPRCGHCNSRPIISQKSWQYLQERDFKWPNPVSSLENPGHYKTFMEISDVDDYLTGEFV